AGRPADAGMVLDVVAVQTELAAQAGAQAVGQPVVPLSHELQADQVVDGRDIVIQLFIGADERIVRRVRGELQAVAETEPTHARAEVIRATRGTAGRSPAA